MGRGKGTILTGRRRVDQAGRRIGIQKLPFSPTGRAPIVRKSSVKLSGLSPREPPPSRRLHASKREYERSALPPKDGSPRFIGDSRDRENQTFFPSSRF